MQTGDNQCHLLTTRFRNKVRDKVRDRCRDFRLSFLWRKRLGRTVGHVREEIRRRLPVSQLDIIIYVGNYYYLV
jgi:hypothetical protein